MRRYSKEWAGRRIHSAHTLSVLEPRGARQCLYYITEITTPLTERNPVAVWRTLAIFFMLTTLAAWMLR